MDRYLVESAIPKIQPHLVQSGPIVDKYTLWYVLPKHFLFCSSRYQYCNSPYSSVIRGRDGRPKYRDIQSHQNSTAHAVPAQGFHFIPKSNIMKISNPKFP
jgi:hypothetical protein